MRLLDIYLSGRALDWHTTEMLAYHCLLQDGSQWLNYGTNPGVPQQKDRQKYSAYWNFTHSQKHEVMPNAGKCIQLEIIILNELNQSHKGTFIYFLSFVASRLCVHIYVFKIAFKVYLFLVYTYVFCLHICPVHLMYSNTLSGQKRVSELLELKLQAVLSYHMGARN